MSEQEFNRIKDCRHGRMIFNINDKYIGRSLDLYGEYSEGEMHLLQRYLHPGDIVIDVGANIGVHTLFFAKRVHPGGVVLAFEPQRLVFQTLCGNMAINSIANTICLNYAVGEKPGQAIVPVLDPAKEHNFGGVELQTGGIGDATQVVTLDSYGLPRCALIKVDVEGMEANVLRGARQLITRTRPILYVECDRPHLAKDVLNVIHSLGYRAYCHSPPLFSEQNFRGKPENEFGNLASMNLVCVPQGQTIADLVPAPMPS